MAERPLILLLDGNALVHRAYHALPPLSSPDGEPTNATFGFTSTLLKVLEDYKPRCAVVAWDVGRTFRHDKYEEYKATRPPLPDDLRLQLERVRDVTDAFNVVSKFVEGYEADDVLATLSEQAEEEGLEVIIVTGDTDTLQLVGPHVKVLLSGRTFSEAKLYDEAAIHDRYGLEPKQLVDFKSLKGDPADNIPGVPGVGKVTASKLLQEFGTIEQVYAHLEEVAPKIREKLEAGREDVSRGKELIQLVFDLPLKLDPLECQLSAYERGRVLELFRELGFHSLVKRLPGGAEGPPTQMPLFAASTSQGETTGNAGYQLISTVDGLRNVVAKIRKAGRCALDTETTSLRPVQAGLVGISLAWQEGQACYVPVGHIPSAASQPQLSLDVLREVLGPVLTAPEIVKIAHNANYDVIVLCQHNLPVRGLHFDTMIAAYLLDPTGRNLGLKGLALQELGVEMMPIEELIGSGRDQLTMDQVSVKRVLPYAAADADMTLRLVARQEPKLKDKGLWELFSDVEMPLVPVLVDMERSGVALDVDYLEQLNHELQKRLGELEKQICHEVGYPFNLNSSQQLSEALFVKLALPTDGVSRGKSGQYSTAASVLEKLKGVHSVVDMILEHRQLAKIKSTYVDALPTLVNPDTGRLHTSWNQTGTVTGRISSSDPNLQNIPIRTEEGRRVRRAFMARLGWMLLGADYSQVELRILAHLSGDQNLLAAFRRGEDIHAHTASTILGVPLSDVTSDMRRVAKTINFGLIYGMSDWGLAERTGLSREDANDFITKYFAQFPSVRAYLARIKQQAQEQGYVETLLGRKRFFPELQSESRAHAGLKAAALRMAINHPIQGTAADIIKIAMIRLHEQLDQQRLRSKMILQVHDELVFEVPDDELEALCRLVCAEMENAYPLYAALKVDLKMGRNWKEME